MEPIRVIGRDLAEQIHAALVAAGADARLATGAPMAVISDTGRDGTGIDVLANGSDVCPAIKKVATQRPVVMVTWDEQGSELASTMAASAAKTARGPDAHLSWPATGRDILAACESAKEAALVRRPRIRWQSVVGRGALLVIGAAILMAFISEIRAMRAGMPHAPSRWPGIILQLVQAGIFAGSGSWSWRRARSSSHPRWHRAWALFAYAFAVFGLFGAVAILFA